MQDLETSNSLLYTLLALGVLLFGLCLWLLFSKRKIQDYLQQKLALEKQNSEQQKEKCELVTSQLAESSEQLRSEQELVTSQKEKLSASNARLDSAEEKIEALEQALEKEHQLSAATKQSLEESQKEREQQDKALAIKERDFLNQEEKLSELRENFDQQKSSLKKEFKVLSEGFLKNQQKELSKTNQEGIQAVLTPLKEEITGFRKRVDAVHSESTKGQGQLEEQLRNLKEMNSSLSDRAENLASALRNDKKKLGNWGELQVAKLLENAGIDKTHFYEREANFKNEDGDNQRPDFIIKLPEKKTLIIDSKVSLNAYVDSVNTDSEDQSLAFIKQHTTNVRNHIKSLSEKDYGALADIDCPDFVFMFMPIESAYLAAFEEDPSLFDFAYDKKIAVVTPNTLLPILKTVSSLWRVDTQNKSTADLALSAAKVHKKFATFLERFEDVEKKINSLQNSFSEAKKSLNTGRGNLIKMAEDFEEKGVKISKKLPLSLASNDSPE